MLVKTLRRLAARPAGETPIYLIASERHADRVRADLAAIDLNGGGAIFEPVGRNTAAAVAVATLQTLAALWRRPGAGRPVRPRDLDRAAVLADDREGRRRGAERAGSWCSASSPTQPETGYGYIEVGGAATAMLDVSRFVEKPDLETAESLSRGRQLLLEHRHLPVPRRRHARRLRRSSSRTSGRPRRRPIEAAIGDVSGLYMPLDLYAAIPSISIDYAIMERASGIAMVPAGFRWNDLGSWQSLLDVSPSDKDGNVIVGDVVAIDCENSYLRSDGRLLSAIGLKDVAIVSTPDATFVAPVSHSQNVKKIVEQLEKSGRLETKFTPAPRPRHRQRRLAASASRHWLFEETLPLWSTAGVDERPWRLSRGAGLRRPRR